MLKRVRSKSVAHNSETIATGDNKPFMQASGLKHQREQFLTDKARISGVAAQRVALQILAKIDLEAVLSASDEIRSNAVMRLNRLIERERLKGMQRHWAYDLNRHIALKQALDKLRQTFNQPHMTRNHEMGVDKETRMSVND